jgi:DNA-binding NarL/FixJ family response regulator
MTIKIGILEDDVPTRLFLTNLFSGDPDFEVCFSAATLAQARTAIVGHRLDVALVDVRLPDGTGLDFIANAKADSDCKILILTVLGDRTSVLLAFEFGASGYLLKDTPPSQIISDVKALIAGGCPISPLAAAHLLSLVNASISTVPPPTDSILTARETDVLVMFSKGMSYRETASVLGLSVHTIADHVKSIYSKMQVRSRSEAVFEAVQNGWLDL